MKFISLFDYIDKTKNYSDEAAVKSIAGIKKDQLSNIKANLYRQLLKSLRLNFVQQDKISGIRENIDFARMLYEKGLYKQSLKLLEKSKTVAKSLEQQVLYLEILEFEKQIELRYITRSPGHRTDELTSQTNKTIDRISLTNQLSNLSLQLYSLYLKVGYIRDEKDANMVKHVFKANLPQFDESKLTFYQKLHLYQAYAWYSYILQDFVKYYRYSHKWVELFDNDLKLEIEFEAYLKGMHNLLTAQFNTLQYHKLSNTLKQLESINIEDARVAENIKLAFHIYRFTHKIEKYFIEGSFTEGVSIVEEIEQFIEENSYKMDAHRVLVLYYKIACLYFGSGDNKNAIVYLNKIIGVKDTDLRQDIHCFARILNLIAHYEMGNEDLVDYQIRSVYRFLAKMDELHRVQLEIFRFLKNLQKISRDQIQDEFEVLKVKLESLKKEKYEQRPFLYLDIISWLDSKVHDVPVQDIIQKNFKKINR